LSQSDVVLLAASAGDDPSIVPSKPVRWPWLAAL